MNTLGKKITTTKISKMEAFPFFSPKIPSKYYSSIGSTNPKAF